MPFLHPRFTADGKAVILLQADGALYHVNAGGTGLTPLTRGFRIETCTLSPDGEYVLFLAMPRD